MAGSYESRPIDCHAHAHILLTSAFVKACNDVSFRVLKGRIDPPPNYFKQNAHSLYVERIQNHEFDSKQIDQFSQHLTNVENAVHVLQTDVHVIKEDMKLMKVEMTSRMDKMETLLDNIHNLLMKKPSEETKPSEERN